MIVKYVSKKINFVVLTEWETVVWAHIDRIERLTCHRLVYSGRECVGISFRVDCTVDHVDSG